MPGTGTVSGRCRCGAVRYVAAGEAEHSSLCHCADCARSAGAPVVGWAMFADDAVRVTGQPTTYESSPGVFRQFCGTCGTGLFYRAEAIFPGKVDIQSATFDDPDAVPPTARIQAADAARWWRGFGDLPTFERFPE